MITIRQISKYFGFNDIRKTDVAFAFICAITGIVLYLLPTGFEGAVSSKSQSVRAQITAVDNESIHQIGLIKTGEQGLTVKILDGRFRGEVFDTVNHFLGKLELDKFYKTGDRVFTVLTVENNIIEGVTVVDRYRLNYEFFIIVIFCGFLLLYAGWTGFQAIISFFFTTLVLWKILLPGYLKYYDPVIFSMVIVTILTAVIIFLVAGFTKKGFVAFAGSMTGVFLTCFLALFFGKFFNIPGEIKPFSETLLYIGFSKLDLSMIFLAGIFISSAGAVMDIAMDVSASMAEISEKNPDIHIMDLILSGFTVGRSVIGTMTTTLLFAYSGSFSTMLMVFIAQGVPVDNILNVQYVSSEILHTVVGSFGLVTVAPLTAIAGGFIYGNYRKPVFKFMSKN
ncbi:MAG: YibE/F family protein [Spirochaetes bacterium]|nr:YibE/F family protein [Spirochaetota bacterium]